MPVDKFKISGTQSMESGKTDPLKDFKDTLSFLLEGNKVKNSQQLDKDLSRSAIIEINNKIVWDNDKEEAAKLSLLRKLENAKEAEKEKIQQAIKVANKEREARKQAILKQYKAFEKANHQAINGPALHNLHQGTMAGAWMLLNNNYRFDRKKGLIGIADDLKKIKMARNNNIFTYELTAPLYSMQDQKTGLWWGIDSKGNVVEVNDPSGAELKKQGYKTLGEIAAIAKMDLTDSPPKNPRASFEVIVKANVPQFEYVGPQKDIQMEVLQVESTKRGFVESIIENIKRLLSFIGSKEPKEPKGPKVSKKPKVPKEPQMPKRKIPNQAIVGSPPSQDLVQRQAAAEKRLKESIQLQKSISSPVAAPNSSQVDEENVSFHGKKTSESDFKSNLKKAEKKLEEKYKKDILDKKIIMGKLPENEKRKYGIQMEISHVRGAEKDILHYYQNSRQEAETTISRDPDYKSIAMVFELNAMSPVLKLDACHDPTSLIKVYKAAKYSGREVQFEESDMKILSRLPEYNLIKDLSQAKYNAFLKDRGELKEFTHHFTPAPSVAKSAPPTLRFDDPLVQRAEKDDKTEKLEELERLEELAGGRLDELDELDELDKLDEMDEDSERPPKNKLKKKKGL
jgi:hypothetical protein